MAQHHEAIERAWDVLFDGLASSDETIWGRVVYAALPRVREQALGRLLHLLESADDVVIARIIEALTSIEDPGGIRTAERFLQSSDIHVRWAAIEYIGACGDETSTSYLISMSEDLPIDSAEHWKLAQALGTAGNQASISALLRVLAHSDHHTVAAAARSLGHIGSSVALPSLIKLLESDAHYEPRGQAAQAIGLIGNRAGIPPLVRAATNQIEDHIVHVDAAVALIRLGHDADPAILVQLLDDPNTNVREWATAWCHWLAYAPAIRKLTEIVEDRNENPDIRLRAIHALSQIGGDDASRTLISLLRDPQERWRSYVALGLADFQGHDVVDALTEALRDDLLDDDALRPEVAVSLANLGQRSVIPILRQNVVEGAEGAWGAVEALARFGDVAVIPELTHELNIPENEERIFAATALIRLLNAA